MCQTAFLFAKMNSLIQYENQTDRVYLEQSFLRTGTQNKRIKKEDRIDVEKSLNISLHTSKAKLSLCLLKKKRSL